MYADLLIVRTKNFALDSIRFFQRLPKTEEARILGKQLLRSSTSVACNYRAANRARSRQEFYSKICIVVEEIDETLFWLELIADAGIIIKETSDVIIKEAQELLYIFSATKKTTKNSLNK
jgi:four helix bundle protein